MSDEITDLKRRIEQLEALLAGMEDADKNIRPKSVSPAPSDRIFLARLLSFDAATGSFTWQELATNADGTNVLRDGGRRGELAASGTLPCPAFEIGGGINLPVGVGANVYIHLTQDPLLGTWTARFAANPVLRFAKLVDPWSYGVNDLISHACNADGTGVSSTAIHLNVLWPPTQPADSPQYFPFTTGDVVAWLPYGETTVGAVGIIVGWRQIPICSERYMVLQGQGVPGSTATTGLVFDGTRAR